jgi:hypothetical protein
LLGVCCRLFLLLLMLRWLGDCRWLCSHKRPPLCQIGPVEWQLQQPLLPLLWLLLLLLARLVT